MVLDMDFFDFSDDKTLRFLEEILLTDPPPPSQNELAEQGTGENTLTTGAGSHVLDNGLADHQQHQQQLVIPDQSARPTSHAFPTGTRHALHHEFINSDLKHEDMLETAGMVNVNNTSVNHQAVLEQPAGSSQLSKDPKKLAKQRSDLKYREKRKQETKDLKRKVDELMERKDEVMERNGQLENENGSLKEEGARMERDLKQCKREVCELKDKLDGLSTTVKEMSKALAESNYIHVQRENERIRSFNLLAKKNPNSLDIIKLQVENAELKRENSARQLVIDALCAKMKKDTDNEPE